MAVSFVGGALIERVIIRPVEQSSPLVIVIVTIGLFLALNSLAQLFFGTDANVVPRAYPLHVWRFGPLDLELRHARARAGARGRVRLAVPAAADARRSGSGCGPSRRIRSRAACSASRSARC